MVNLNVKLEQLKTDYPDFYDFFKNTLENSNSKYKKYKESKYNSSYYIGFYMKKSQKTKDYYEKLYSMVWDDRVKEEYTKVRISITMSVGKFLLSDQTNVISDTAKIYIDEIVSRKMYFEQLNSPETNETVLNSIPNLDELVEKIDQEIKNQKDFLSKLGEKLGITTTKERELTPEEKLKQLINDEKYEEANDLINKHDELKNKE